MQPYVLLCYLVQNHLVYHEENADFYVCCIINIIFNCKSTVGNFLLIQQVITILFIFVIIVYFVQVLMDDINAGYERLAELQV